MQLGLDMAAVNQLVVELLEELESTISANVAGVREEVLEKLDELSSTVSDASAGVDQNQSLIEGTRTSIDILIEAMRAHTDALQATNDTLRHVIKRVVVLEGRAAKAAKAAKEKPPDV